MKERKGGEVVLRHLALRDNHSDEVIKVAVFGDDARSQYQNGDCVKITKVYPWTSPSKKKYLGMRRDGQLEVCNHMHLQVYKFKINLI